MYDAGNTVITGVGSAAPSAIDWLANVWNVAKTPRVAVVLVASVMKTWWKSVARCDAAGMPKAESAADVPPLLE